MILNDAESSQSGLFERLGWQGVFLNSPGCSWNCLAEVPFRQAGGLYQQTLMVS